MPPGACIHTEQSINRSDLHKTVSLTILNYVAEHYVIMCKYTVYIELLACRMMYLYVEISFEILCNIMLTDEH